MPRKERPPEDRTDALRDMLRRLHPSMDVDAAVDALMMGRTSPRALPEMSIIQLSQQFPERTAELIHLIPGMARKMLRDNYPARPSLGTMREAAHFLRGHYLGLSYEHCYLLLLKKNRRLIREVMIQSGTVDSLPFYSRNIVEAVLTHQADAVILSHNHPGGTIAPSQADVESTCHLIAALEPLATPLIDHLIITDDQALSLREMGIIPPEVWLRQPNCCPALLKNWLQRPAR